MHHTLISTSWWGSSRSFTGVISFESWIEKSTVLGEPIHKSKDRVRDRLENICMIIDKVSGANAKTSTNNNGNTARNFFSQTQVDVMVGCADS